MKRVMWSDTKPELTLHKLGFRYVIGDQQLPGTRDLAFRERKAALFVQHNCRQGRAPLSNAGYLGAQDQGDFVNCSSITDVAIQP